MIESSDPNQIDNFASQEMKILAYMKMGKKITGFEALNQFGCFRLPARIHNLNQNGHIIHKQMIEVTTRDGKSRVAEYWM